MMFIKKGFLKYTGYRFRGCISRWFSVKETRGWPAIISGKRWKNDIDTFVNVRVDAVSHFYDYDRKPEKMRRSYVSIKRICQRKKRVTNADGDAGKT